MRPIILRLIQRRLGGGALTIFCLILNFSAALAGKEASPQPKLNPLSPTSNSSTLSISVQIDPAVDVDPDPSRLPNSFALQQNYPNPFNSSTSITYSCAKESFVSIEVYNILGQEVATLVSGRTRPGVYSILWNSKDRLGNLLPSGVYFYRMISDSYIETRKLVILR